MKKLISLALTTLCLQSVAYAGGVPEITCTDGSGFSAILRIEAGTSLGSLTFGQEGEEAQTIEGLDTSFNADWGAATKSGEVLFVVTPLGEHKLGQLIVDGKTHTLLCD